MNKLTALSMSSLILLSGCGFVSSLSSQSPDSTVDTTPNAVPVPDNPSTVDEGTESETDTPVPGNVQVYQDDNGMFALALPAGYSYEPLDQGLTFISADNGFAGEIVYQAAQNSSSSILAMERELKAIIKPKFSQINWQKAGQRQPDGSVRLAWTGVDNAGQSVDALSFIETHGEHSFALSVYALDQQYNEYSNDARIIVGTYVVRQGPTAVEASANEDSDPSEDASEDADTTNGNG